MSTPIPPNTKLEGIDLYVPRGARTPSALLPHVSECDQERADEREQPSAAVTELPTVADTPVNDTIGTAPSLPDQEPSISASSLPPAPNLRSVIEPSAAFAPPWLRTAPRRRLRLDPEIVPPPPAGARPHIVVPMLIVLMVGCTAVIALTMITAFQPDARSPKRTTESIPTAAPTFDKPGIEPRLVVDFQKALANESSFARGLR